MGEARTGRYWLRSALRATAGLCLALYLRSLYVTRHCGYDCQIFGAEFDSGPVAVLGTLLAPWVGIACVAWLVASHVSQWRQEKPAS